MSYSIRVRQLAVASDVRSTRSTAVSQKPGVWGSCNRTNPRLALRR